MGNEEEAVGREGEREKRRKKQSRRRERRPTIMMTATSIGLKVA